MPADEGQTGRTTAHRSRRDADLWQTAKTGYASQSHGPYPERFEPLARGRQQWRDRRRRRQRQDRARRQVSKNMSASVGNYFARPLRLFAGHARSEVHALLYSRTELRFGFTNKSTKRIPYFFSLDDAERFPPGIEARRGDRLIDACRQERSASIKKFPA